MSEFIMPVMRARETYHDGRTHCAALILSTIMRFADKEVDTTQRMENQ